jgi:hypothetical protein
MKINTFRNIIIFMILFSAFQVKSQYLIYESFNYPLPSYIGGNGDAGSFSYNWTTHSNTAGVTTTINLMSGNLTYNGLFASEGNKLYFFSNGNSTPRDVNRAFNPTNTTAYYSALIKIIDASQILSTFDYFMSFGDTNGSVITTLGGRLGIKSVNANANFRFGILNTAGGTNPLYTEYPQDLIFGTTYFIVVKYDISTVPTTATLWVNPVIESLEATEPTGYVTNNIGTGFVSTLASICLRNNYASPKAEIDEIRVGLNWASVTPRKYGLLPIYESFNHPVGDSLPMHDWIGINSGDQILVTGGNLNYPGFASFINGNKISFNGSGRDFQKTFTKQKDGTVYMSFIFQVTDASVLDTLNSSYFAGFGQNYTVFGSTVWIRKSGLGFNVGLNARSTTNTIWDNTVYDLNSPILIVVSYQFDSINPDIANIWINPSDSSFGSVTEPIPSITIQNSEVDLSEINRIFIRQSHPTHTPFIDLDYIRVGLTWKYVTDIPLPNPICLVSVDTNTWKNNIIWEKTSGARTYYFAIYKETSIDIYNLLGTVPYDSVSSFIDITSVPESHGDKYKISAVDTCGNESVKSPYHKTMNLVISTYGSTMGLSWTPFEDESGVFVPGNYYIYRGLLPNNMHIIDSISASFTSYNDNNVFNQYYYMVGVRKANGCNIGNKTYYSTSFSNKKQSSVGFEELEYSGTILISPNPMSSSSTLTIPNFQPQSSTSKITITDITGKVVREAGNDESGNFQINPSSTLQIEIKRGNLKPGVYFVELKADRIYRGKLVVE